MSRQNCGSLPPSYTAGTSAGGDRRRRYRHRCASRTSPGSTGTRHARRGRHAAPDRRSLRHPRCLARPTSSRTRRLTASCWWMAARRQGADALLRAVGRPAGRRVRSARSSTPTGIRSRPARTSGSAQGRRDDHRAREHAPVADDRRHLAVERPALHPPAARPRSPDKTFYTTAHAPVRRALRLHPGRGAHRRRPLRVLPGAERARRGRRGVGTGLAGRRLGDRRLDRRHRRRPAAAADAGQRQRRGLCRRADRCSALAEHQDADARCTRRSTTA